MSLKRYIALFAMKIAQLFPIKKNKVVFCSFHGKYCNDIPRKVFELVKDNNNLSLVWISEKNTNLPKNVKVVKPESLKEIYELATAKVWVDNARKSFWIRKKKNQVYFQTWHGPVCIKAVEADAPTLNFRYVEKAKNDSKMASYIVSQCEWRTKNIMASFWYNGPIIKGDTSRDVFESINERNNRVREFYGIDKDTKILLYAPTFRNHDDFSVYDIDFDRLEKHLANKFGGKWAIIFRLHPNISHLFSRVDCQGVLNGSSYSNMDDLLVSCDILISDFSGCIFNAFRLKKMVFLYASDYDYYTSSERKLYFNLSELPSSLSRNNDALFSAIDKFDKTTYLNNVNSFNDSLGYYSDDAIKIIGDMINKLVFGG